MQDFPLSYIEMENGKPVGRGVAFKVLEFLTEKFNFTINIVPLEKDIIGSKTDYQGSLVECLNESVSYMSFVVRRKDFLQFEFFS